MHPVSPVIPNKDFTEAAVAEHQDEFQTLPAIPLEDGVVLCRWQPKRIKNKHANNSEGK